MGSMLTDEAGTSSLPLPVPQRLPRPLPYRYRYHYGYCYCDCYDHYYCCYDKLPTTTN